MSGMGSMFLGLARVPLPAAPVYRESEPKNTPQSTPRRQRVNTSSAAPRTVKKKPIAKKKITPKKKSQNKKKNTPPKPKAKALPKKIKADIFA